MRIQCLGETAAEYRARVDAKAAQTVRTSDAMMLAFNDAGGNTPLSKKSDAGFMASATTLFDKVWGILSLPKTPAGAERKTVIAPSAPVPLAAFAAVGILAFALYKVGK